jgi:ankyrin repeat protein
MANRDSITEIVFTPAQKGSDWFENLKPLGSCKVLRDLLRENPHLLREMGDGDVTVLHMAVRHGCAELVEDVLNMFKVGGQCNSNINLTQEDLLSKRNAEGLTAIGMAVMNGSFKVVRLLKGAIHHAVIHHHPVIHHHQIISSLNYLTWNSMRIIHSPNSDPMDDDWNGQMNNVASSSSSSYSTDEDAPSLTLPTVPTIPASMRDDLPLESGRVEMEEDEKEVHEIIQRVCENPINYMENLPKPQICNANYIYGTFEDFREKNSGFTEEHVQKCIDYWVDECEKHPEFEFVQAKEVLIHFLCSVNSICWDTTDVDNYRRHVRFYFIAAVVRECALRGLLSALFKLHDPQGRTPLHVAIEYWNLDIVDMFWRVMQNKELVGDVSDEQARACWNARDAAGRTPLHAMVVSKYDNAKYLLRINWVDVDARVCPQHYEEWVALLHWKAPCVTLSPKFEEQEHCTAIHLAVLHNKSNVVHQLIKFPPQSKANYLNDHLRRGLSVQSQDHEILMRKGGYLSAIQLAASMGHIHILILLLKVWK